MKDREKLTGCLCAVSCETLFGLSYVFTRYASGEASALALLGWRFLFAVVTAGICVASGLLKVSFRGKRLLPLLKVALCCPCVYFICETLGISRTTASESGVLLACIPIASLASSSLVLKHRPTRRQLTGILITLAGAVMAVLAAEMSADFSVTGYGMLLAAIISYALYSVFVEEASDYSSAEITVVMQLAGAAVYVPLALIEAGVAGQLTELLTLPVRSPGFLIASLYQGAGCAVLAFFLDNRAIAALGVNRTSSFIGISTVVSMIAGFLVLGETVNPGQIAGALLIVAGVCVANLG